MHLQAGMAALLLANLINFSLRWLDTAAVPWAYGAMGVLYGASFTLLLKTRRRC